MLLASKSKWSQHKEAGVQLMMNLNCSIQSYAALDDHDLVIACQHQIPEAFNALYRRYKLYAHGVLRKLAPDLKQNHEDIVQDVFIRVWKSIGTLRNASAFKSWLRRLITNIFYDELRSKPKEFVLSLDEPSKDSEDTVGVWYNIADDKAQPDENFERKEIVSQVKAAIDLLPEQFKTVIILREFCGFTYEEIANETHTEIGTVKSRVARARTKMQFHLEKVWAA